MNLKNQLKRHKVYKNALKIVKTLSKNGFKTYFAGGAVRDEILKKAYDDIDIVSSAKPEDVERLFKRTFHVGNQFGISIIAIQNIYFEVATFRKDLEYLDGRHPKGIEYADEKEDAFRRDFTINGLFYDPIKKKILDYVNGKKDIKKKVIRAIGNPEKRFHEDKLRILRAIRLSVQLDYKIARKTWEALRSNPQQILMVSQERIREELIKIFQSKEIFKGFKILNKSKLLLILFPEFAKVISDKEKLSSLLNFLRELAFAQKKFFALLGFFFFFKTSLNPNHKILYLRS